VIFTQYNFASLLGFLLSDFQLKQQQQQQQQQQRK
jgi:hypothetical protein